MHGLEVLQARNQAIAADYYARTTPLERLQRHLRASSLLQPSEKKHILVFVLNAEPEQQAILADTDILTLHELVSASKTEKATSLQTNRFGDELALIRLGSDGCPLCD